MKARLSVMLLLVGLSILFGCASAPSDLTAELVEARAPSAEAYLRDATARYQEGAYEEAAELVHAALRGATAYRVMPRLLYLLGECELALGNRQKAARSLELLKSYYPRRWSALPERQTLDAVVDEQRMREERAESGIGASWVGSGRVGVVHAPGPHGERPVNSGDPSNGARVTNVFYETDILQVLADISAQAGVPIVASEGVRGFVTMEFDGVPLEECLRRLSLPLGLGYRWMDGYYLVGTVDPRDPESLLLTGTIQVRPQHVLAKDVLSLLPEAYAHYVRVDEAGGNTLTASGPPEVLDRLLHDLAEVDKPARQVMIEALIVELGSDLTREWGIDWEIIGSEGNDEFRIANLAPAMLDSAFVGRILSTGVDVLGGVGDVSVALKALEATGGARIRANPHVATLDGREAKIRVGSEAYYSLLSGSVSYAYYTLQKIATGTALKITPYVAASSEIITDISIEVSDVRTTGANDLPVTSVREVETRACVGNGESVMIGGLLSETERTKDTRIPVLGRIPMLGALFGYTSVEREETEMFVLVTPHIMIHPTELAGLLQ